VIVVDAGVVIGVATPGDPHGHSARSALAAARAQDEDLVLPASAYAEVLVHPFRLGGEAVWRVDRFVDRLPMRIHPIGSAVAKAAARLRARHGHLLPLPDAFVIATAEVLAADTVLTTDRAWPSLEVPVTVLRP
jgi:PIN domain nuclease of toxin-antitoxin system